MADWLKENDVLWAAFMDARDAVAQYWNDHPEQPWDKSTRQEFSKLVTAQTTAHDAWRQHWYKNTNVYIG